MTSELSAALTAERLEAERDHYRVGYVRLRAALLLDPETAGRLWHETVCRLMGGPVSRDLASERANDERLGLAFLAALRAHGGLEVTR